ncbi:tRNA lysidine(34) synthetase TilS [Rhizobium sp. S152]|uniref:tRNA lysidine(34) synthetase TilS n=1 Tax=Rhizobium sp. S152 TaxID=3055038 RepID=UPI0025AA06B9|nr:tRNA lysidine(34) synthetase TilS [Rhizobium sp. S152]MDM9625948.1 tRNA lysidine(34) synthetase TilS [Rhizobium sp. S152]
MRPDGILSLETATRRFLLSLGQPTRILVAISGGSDSTGLLVALSDALKAEPHLEISLCAATIDHALRPQSADEARAVAALCATFSLAHVTKVWRGEKPKAGIMAAARDARYALLAEAAREFGADIIVTAHTLDDQRETFAMRGLRSAANVTGISDAVLFDRRIWVARPLLLSLRADIRVMLDQRGVGWSDDPSNEDPKYERVRTRQSLAGEGVSVDEIEAMTAARQALDEDAAAWLDAHVRVHGGMLAQVDTAGLTADRSLLAHGLARLAAVLGGQAFALGSKAMAGVLDFLAAGRPGRVTAGRVVFDLRRDGLFLARESRGMLPLTIAAGARGVWDGRYAIENRTGSEVVVSAQGAGGDTAEVLPDHTRLLKSAVARALAAQPRIVSIEASDDRGNQIEIAPYFAPFDRFLTRLDVKFAASLAAAFGTRPYPKPPLGLIDGKTI